MKIDSSLPGIKATKGGKIIEIKGVKLTQGGKTETMWDAIKDIAQMLADASKWSIYTQDFASVKSWGVNPLNVYVDSTASSVAGYAGIESTEFIDLSDANTLTINVASALMNNSGKIYAPEVQFIDAGGNIAATINLANNSLTNWTNKGGTSYGRENFSCNADISNLNGSYKVRLRIGNIGYGGGGQPMTVHAIINSMILT